MLDTESPFEANARTLVALVLCVLVGALANAAGVGGGALYIPLFNVLIGFSLKDSTALSQAAITAGALLSVTFNVSKVHPADATACLIDFDLALMLTPIILVGVTIGVQLNRLLTGWLISIILLCLLVLLVSQAVLKGSVLWKKESKDRALKALKKQYGSSRVTSHMRSGRAAAAAVSATSGQNSGTSGSRPGRIASSASPGAFAPGRGGGLAIIYSGHPRMLGLPAAAAGGAGALHPSPMSPAEGVPFTPGLRSPHEAAQLANYTQYTNLDASNYIAPGYTNYSTNSQPDSADPSLHGGEAGNQPHSESGLKRDRRIVNASNQWQSRTEPASTESSAHGGGRGSGGGSGGSALARNSLRGQHQPQFQRQSQQQQHGLAQNNSPGTAFVRGPSSLLATTSVALSVGGASVEGVPVAAAAPVEGIPTPELPGTGTATQPHRQQAGGGHMPPSTSVPLPTRSGGIGALSLRRLLVRQKSAASPALSTRRGGGSTTSHTTPPTAAAGGQSKTQQQQLEAAAAAAGTGALESQPYGGSTNHGRGGLFAHLAERQASVASLASIKSAATYVFRRYIGAPVLRRSDAFRLTTQTLLAINEFGIVMSDSEDEEEEEEDGEDQQDDDEGGDIEQGQGEGAPPPQQQQQQQQQCAFGSSAPEGPNNHPGGGGGDGDGGGKHVHGHGHAHFADEPTPFATDAAAATAAAVGVTLTDARHHHHHHHSPHHHHADTEDVHAHGSCDVPAAPTVQPATATVVNHASTGSGSSSTDANNNPAIGEAHTCSHLRPKQDRDINTFESNNNTDGAEAFTVTVTGSAGNYDATTCTSASAKDMAAGVNKQRQAALQNAQQELAAVASTIMSNGGHGQQHGDSTYSALSVTSSLLGNIYAAIQRFKVSHAAAAIASTSSKALLDSEKHAHTGGPKLLRQKSDGALSQAVSLAPVSSTATALTAATSMARSGRRTLGGSSSAGMASKRSVSSKRRKLTDPPPPTKVGCCFGICDGYVAAARRLPWRAVGLVVLAWSVFVALQIGRAELPRCSGGWWALMAVQLVVMGGISGVYMAVRKSEQEPDNTPEMVKATLGIDTTMPGAAVNAILAAPLKGSAITFVAGLTGGLLGLGGGMVMSPVLLELGVHPQVTAATSSLLVLFSSSSALITFALLGALNPQYAAVYAAATAVSSVTGVYLVAQAVRKTGRTSLVVFMLATVMALGGAFVGAFGIKNAVTQIEHGAVRFGSFC